MATSEKTVITMSGNILISYNMYNPLISMATGEKTVITMSGNILIFL